MKKIATLNLNILRVEESFGYLKLVSAETPLLNPGGNSDHPEIDMPINMAILPTFRKHKKAEFYIT